MDVKTNLLVLGIESSCDETGVALVQARAGQAVPTLLAHALHSQIEMHQAYGGVVPELASRDHIRRVLPLTEAVLAEAGQRHAGFIARRFNTQDQQAHAPSVKPGARTATPAG